MWKKNPQLQSRTFRLKYIFLAQIAPNSVRMCKLILFQFGIIVFLEIAPRMILALPPGKNMATENLVENITVAFTSNSSLPRGWDEFCVESNKSSPAKFYFTCTVDKYYSGVWNYSQIASYISSRNVKYGFDIECLDGANISLRWPGKAKNLIELRVRNCLITDFYGDYESKTLATFPDQLEYLVLSNNMVLVDIFDLVYFAGSIVNITQDALCGNDESLVEMKISNMTYNFGASTEIFFAKLLNKTTGTHDIENDPVVNDAQNLYKDIFEVNHICNYKRLRKYDNSINSHPSTFYVDVKTERSLYPVLETLNLSYTSFGKQYSVDDLLNDWAVFYPTLKLMDISHCNVQLLDVSNKINDADSSVKHVLHVNLTGNNISELQVPVLESLVNIQRIYLNFSDNPLNCSCTEDMKELIRFVLGESKWREKKYQRYDFIREMKCYHPLQLRGTMLKDLRESQLLCTNDVTMTETIVVEAVVVLSILSLFLLVAIIILVKFRREIRILTYTRFHILLPFQPEEAFEEKTFDAFVSYSNEDQEWVSSLFENDEIEGLRSFKFCLHQRDFMPGKTITENIVDCIEGSRHTIVIVSKHFLDSSYCLYEFEEALRQSISERKRHLLVIILEEISKEEMPKVLQTSLKTFTYIKKDDSIFLDRLIFSLSYKGRDGKKKKASKTSGHENNAFEERIEEQDGMNNYNKNVCKVDGRLGNLDNEKTKHYNIFP